MVMGRRGSKDSLGCYSSSGIGALWEGAEDPRGPRWVVVHELGKLAEVLESA